MIRSDIPPIERIEFDSLVPGVRLLVLGAVHGNETCGTMAIRGLVEDIRAGRLLLASGKVSFVPVANPLAYARGTRMGDRNLNRALFPREQAAEFEDRVANWLYPILAGHDALLDLHSFHTPGQPFVMLGPENNTGTLEPFARADDETAWALRLGVNRLVDGWLDTYAAGARRRAGDYRYGVGTTETMRTLGGIALTLECGQHADPAAPAVARHAVLNSLAHFGLVEAPAPTPVADPEMLRLVAVFDREAEGDRLARPFASFDRVEPGEVIGVRAQGEVIRAPHEAFVVFPNPGAAAGTEWFYLARRARRGEAQPRG